MSKDVLVIGGGISGIQAALDLAEMGIKVHLVEASPSIGGRMAQLDKTFPTNDCSICILAPKMSDCSRHPNINLMTYSEVTGVKGQAGDFEIEVTKKPRYIDETKCVGCGDCVEKCPVKVKDEFDMKLRDRKAIDFYFAQAVPRLVAIDPEHCRKLTQDKCGVCAKVCKREAVVYDQKPIKIKLNVASIIVATGLDPIDMKELPQFGYGRNPNVVTGLEFERISSASGPTGGRLVRMSDREPAHRLAFIQCVGSRDVRHSRYCSSVCCMHSTKEAIIAREHEPGVESTIFYTEFRAVGKWFMEYRTRAEKEYGVRYIRSRVSSVDMDEKGLPIVHYEDPETGRGANQEFDLVILATSLVPRKGAGALAELLGIELDEYGFYKTEPYNQLKTTKHGIYTCGYARGPVDIPESVSQGSAAAECAAEAVTAAMAR